MTEIIAPRPQSDPSELTTRQLHHEIEAVKELLQSATNSELDLTNARFEAAHAKIDLIQSTINSIPPDIDRVVGQLGRLHEEKFRSIELAILTKFEAVSNQFIAFDKLREQLSLAAGTAVAAALQAQKESAGATQDANAVALTKMENSFTKQIDQVSTSLIVVSKNTDEKINDLKGRLDRGEGRTSVSDPAVSNGIAQLTSLVQNLSQSRDTSAGHSAGQTHLWGGIVGGVGMIIAIISIGISIAAFSSRGTSNADIGRYSTLPLLTTPNAGR
jgi:hypothetical protein